jgi:hypothetical protein
MAKERIARLSTKAVLELSANATRNGSYVVSYGRLYPYNSTHTRLKAQNMSFEQLKSGRRFERKIIRTVCQSSFCNTVFKPGAGDYVLSFNFKPFKSDNLCATELMFWETEEHDYYHEQYHSDSNGILFHSPSNRMDLTDDQIVKYLTFLTNNKLIFPLTEHQIKKKLETQTFVFPNELYNNTNQYYFDSSLIRYIHEGQGLVTSMLNFIERYPTLDPWVVVALAHLSTIKFNVGHSIFDPRAYCRSAQNRKDRVADVPYVCKVAEGMKHVKQNRNRFTGGFHCSSSIHQYVSNVKSGVYPKSMTKLKQWRAK